MNKFCRWYIVLNDSFRDLYKAFSRNFFGKMKLFQVLIYLEKHNWNDLLIIVIKSQYFVENYNFELLLQYYKFEIIKNITWYLQFRGD